MQNKIRRFFIFIVKANPNLDKVKVSENRAQNKINLFVFLSRCILTSSFEEKVSDELFIFIVGTGFMPVSKQQDIWFSGIHLTIYISRDGLHARQQTA